MGSEYVNLRQKIIQRMDSDKIDDQILGVVETAFADAVRKENVILSRVVQKRLLAQVTKSISEAILKALGARSNNV